MGKVQYNKTGGNHFINVPREVSKRLALEKGMEYYFDVDEISKSLILRFQRKINKADFNPSGNTKVSNNGSEFID